MNGAKTDDTNTTLSRVSGSIGFRRSRTASPISFAFGLGLIVAAGLTTAGCSSEPTRQDTVRVAEGDRKPVHDEAQPLAADPIQAQFEQSAFCKSYACTRTA